MGDEPSASIPPELRVLLDLELTVADANSPADHQKLQAALVDVPGVNSVSFPEGKIAIQYDPQKITKARLTELIGSAGFSVSGSDSAPPVPPVDAKG
jgi:hypothetical protein